jgi:hypothetical protein
MTSPARSSLIARGPIIIGRTSAAGGSMDDTSNWETAAAIAAICVGLGGLLLFTLVAALAVWRGSNYAQQAARDADAARRGLEDAERRLGTLEQGQNSELMNEPAGADAFLGQQAILREAVRGLVEATRATRAAQPDSEGRLEESIARLDESLARLAAAVAALKRRSG